MKTQKRPELDRPPSNEGWQFVRLKNFMQPTFVTCEITFIIRKEKSIRKRPTIANVKVFFAPSSCLGSPPDVINFMPEKIIKKRATIPAKVRSQKITF